MQSAEQLFSVLAKKARNSPEFRFRRIYRNLFQSFIYHSQANDSKLGQDEIVAMCKLLETEKYRPKEILKTSEGRQFQQMLEVVLAKILESIYPESKQIPEMIYNNFSQSVQTFRRSFRPSDWFYHLQLPLSPIQRVITQKIEDGRWWRLIQEVFQSGRMTEKIGNLYYREILSFLQNKFSNRVQTAFIMGNHLFILINEPFIQSEKDECRFLWGEEMRWKQEVSPKSRGSFFEFDWCWETNRNRLFLLIPPSSLAKMIQPFQQRGRPIHLPNRLHFTPTEIWNLFQREERQIRQKFELADNSRTVLHKFHYYHYQSLLLTLAKKEKVSVKKIKQKYRYILSRYGERQLESHIH
ncbi:hypothetical protein [Risungbinella massiliensis]|uniref:hypothetical protein n=1 Tax=Risungbinella massiliensis TaxID=1329796 RepID=UPI0005CC112D|nr:hypothetical protein [Risungbinella massiliensis]